MLKYQTEAWDPETSRQRLHVTGVSRKRSQHFPGARLRGKVSASLGLIWGILLFVFVSRANAARVQGNTCKAIEIPSKRRGMVEWDAEGGVE